jgi:hypothetical protein
MRTTVHPTQLAAFAFACLIALAVSCGGGASSPLTAADLCAATPDPEQHGISIQGGTEEISGVVTSGLSDDLIWAHNDSGDAAQLYAFDRAGFHHATYGLPGVEAIDWEDMARGPGPKEDAPHLYIGDIGDNAAQRPEVSVYRVLEPEVTKQPDTPTAHELDADAVDRLTLVYPDHPHDAETLLVDPIDGDLLIVTKEYQTPAAFVFRAPGGLEDGSTTTLEEVAQIDLGALGSTVDVPPEAPDLVRGAPNLPTGGDVAPDGSLVAIRTYASVWVWSRAEGRPLWSAFDGAPCEATSVIEPQGEAIAFDADGRGYFTVSEGSFPPFHHFAVAD